MKSDFLIIFSLLLLIVQVVGVKNQVKKIVVVKDHQKTEAGNNIFFNAVVIF